MAFKSTMLNTYKARSGIAHGGIGSGGMELRADGIFRNINIFNNEPFGTKDRYPFFEDSTLFFKVRWQEEGENPKMKILQIEEGYEVGCIKSQPHYYIFPWMTGIERIDYEASFPYSTLLFTDSEMPFDIKMKVFTPFIPHDVKNSSLPGIFFEFEIVQKGDKKCDVLLMASMRNGVGYDVKDKTFRTDIKQDGDFLACQMTCDGMDEKHFNFGYQTIASFSKDSSYYVGWEHLHPYYEIVLRSAVLPNINDTAGRNSMDKELNKEIAGERLFSTLGVSKALENREVFKHTFAITWSFPNLYAQKANEADPERIEGHYHTNFFANAFEVASYMYENYCDLKKRTAKFYNDFFDSSIDPVILDQVNSQFNTFITSAWLTKDKNFGIIEGLTTEHSWGPIATTDVGMYGSIMIASLFPELDKQIQRVHKSLQGEAGDVSHGINMNFEATDEGSEDVGSRLDMPSQYVVQTLRGYFWTKDMDYLEEMWESCKKAVDYCLDKRDFNGDCVPDMQGVMCSYDNFPMYGAASYIASQWLAALQYMIFAAEDIGDEAALEKYTKVYEVAQKNAERKLWNGEYFRLYNDEGGERGDMDDGCLTDQIIGQWACGQIGCQDIYSKSKIKKALGYVFKRNYTKEYGLVNCRWPEDEFLHEVDPNCWNDQGNTCWSGVELGFAALLIQEGLVEEGLEVIKNVDNRYRRSNIYFDHMEFGGHYFRAMSAWGIINAMLGLSYQGSTYSFDPKVTGLTSNMFFVTGNGTAHFKHDAGEGYVMVRADSGALPISRLVFTNKAVEGFMYKGAADGLTVSVAGRELDEDEFTLAVDVDGSVIDLILSEEIELKEDESIVVYNKK